MTSTIAFVRGPIMVAAVVGVGQERRAGVEVAGPDPVELQPHVVVEVVGDRHDDLVAGLGEGRRDHAERLVAAAGRQDLRRGDRRAVVGAELGGERFVEGRDAGGRGVASAVARVRDLGDPRRDLGCGRVARGGLGQVEEGPLARAMGQPGVSFGDRRRGEGECPVGEPHGLSSVRSSVAARRRGTCRRRR